MARGVFWAGVYLSSSSDCPVYGCACCVCFDRARSSNCSRRHCHPIHRRSTDWELALCHCRLRRGPRLFADCLAVLGALSWKSLYWLQYECAVLHLMDGEEEISRCFQQCCCSWGALWLAWRTDYWAHLTHLWLVCDRHVDFDRSFSRIGCWFCVTWPQQVVATSMHTSLACWS